MGVDADRQAVVLQQFQELAQVPVLISVHEQARYPAATAAAAELAMTPGLSCAGGRAADTAVGGDRAPILAPESAMRSELDVGVEKRDVPLVIRFRNDALDQVPAEHRHAHQRLAALGGIDGVPGRVAGEAGRCGRASCWASALRSHVATSCAARR